MPYPGSFNKDELLKIALLWGKYDNIENQTARIDNVRWLWGVILAELRRLQPTTILLLQNTAQGYCETCQRTM